MTLYQRILGPDFEKLPTPVQSFHAEPAKHRYRGEAQIARGAHPLARLTCAVIGFPQPGEHVPVEVTIAPSKLGELWVRNFAGKRFSSFQAEGVGRSSGLIVESFGPIRVCLALQLVGEKLRLVPKSWSFLGLPLPAALLPGGDTYETQLNGVFHFHVEIKAPVMGLIVSYKGTLIPA